MGQKSAELVINRIEEYVNEKTPKPFNTVIIKTDLILRQSTK